MASTLPKQSQKLIEPDGKIDRIWYLFFAGLQANAGMAIPFRSLPPNPQIGQLAVVADSSVNSWGGTADGAGALTVMVWWNGAIWSVFGS